LRGRLFLFILIYHIVLEYGNPKEEIRSQRGVLTMSEDIQNALISVSEKKGVVEFAQALREFDIGILSTGGTADELRANNVPVTQVSAYTGFAEMMGDRVKTLHPKIHGGLLALRNDPDHIQSMEEHGIVPIDLLVVNFYPFVEEVAKKDVTAETGIKQIDIGGPAMIRSAAKNFLFVTVVCDPADYSRVEEEIRENGGNTTLATRRELAAKAFDVTSAYDLAVSNFIGQRVAVEEGDRFSLRW
jgi:phosphoribosylaminoimidazolecarboxamide formyltransferase/IMP cyclohydrolase